MKTKAVIFDKDGTLMDFDAFWVTVSRCAIGDIVKKLGLKDVPVEEIVCCLDVEDGVADINGILAQDPYPVMGKAINDGLKKYGVDLSDSEMTEMTIEAYHGNIEKGIVRPGCVNISDVMSRLKKMGMIIGLVTTDDPYDTEKCLKRLGIYEYFDEIYTDDGILPPKPDPYVLNLFCEKYGLRKDEVIMVGDTLNDVRFARNGGIRVLGVAKNNKNRLVLESYADGVAEDVSGVFDFLK